MAGGLADVFGVHRAIGAVGALTFLSGTVVATVMYETRRDLVASASGSGVLARAWKYVALRESSSERSRLFGAGAFDRAV